MFTLSVGFRPARDQNFTDKVEEIVVAPMGEVISYGSSLAELDGITFRAGS